MPCIFKAGINREIYVANQNYFQTPIRHPSHTVDMHIISYVLKGGWKLKIGDEIINAKKDSLFIQPANIVRTGLEPCPPNTNTMFIHFSRKEGDEYTSAESLDLPPASLLLDTFSDASGNDKIKDILMKIFEEKVKENDIKASVYLNLLLCELSENISGGNSPYSYAIDIKKYINRNLSRNLSNSEIANAINTSVRTAETAFKKSFGMTIHKYQLIRKIEQAKFRLEYFPSMKINEISRSLGFFDEYHFSKQFKQITGISPMAYRKNVLMQKSDK